MNWRKVSKWLGILLLALGIGGFVIGGIVYATTSGSRDEAPSTAQTDEPISATVVAQEQAEAGIVIAAVAPDGPAAKAGVVRSDILLEIDGQAVNTPLQLQRRLTELEAGNEVTLKVLHGDEERTFTVTLGESNGRAYLGLTPCGGLRIAERLSVLPETRGALIVRVQPDSPAERAGLQQGDRILEVDGQELDVENDLAELITAHKPGDNVVLSIRHPGEDPLDVTVELGEHPEKEGVAYLGVEYQLTRSLETFDNGVWPFNGQPFDMSPFGSEPFVMPPGAESQQGAVIRRIVEAGPAEQAGLQVGDVITALDAEPVESPQGLIDALAERQPGDKITLSILRPGEEEERQIEITLGENPDEEGKAYLGVILGFFRVDRFEEGQAPDALEPLERFFERFQGSFEFKFQMPRELFEEEPCCSEDSAA